MEYVLTIRFIDFHEYDTRTSTYTVHVNGIAGINTKPHSAPTGCWTWPHLLPHAFHVAGIGRWQPAVSLPWALIWLLFPEQPVVREAPQLICLYENHYSWLCCWFSLIRAFSLMICWMNIFLRTLKVWYHASSRVAMYSAYGTQVIIEHENGGYNTRVSKIIIGNGVFWACSAWSYFKPVKALLRVHYEM